MGRIQRIKKSIWIILILGIAGYSCQSVALRTAETTLTQPLAIPVTGGSAEVPASAPEDIFNPHAPVINSIEFPEIILSSGEFGLGEVDFRDLEGDIHSAQFTRVGGGCMEFEYFAFNPMDFMRSGDHFAGTFQFQQACVKCENSRGDEIRMQIQLYDLEGNESQPVEYSFTCD